MSEPSAISVKDLTGIRALLERNGLPTSDLDSSRPEFAVIREQGQVIAAGALQRFGSSALLRSVVVAADRRGMGLGQTIVNELERMARAAQINRLMLLTQTAAEFFARRGYRVIERSTAPQNVQESAEFRSLCPSAATCMAKNLRDLAEPSEGTVTDRSVGANAQSLESPADRGCSDVKRRGQVPRALRGRGRRVRSPSR